MGTRKTFLHSQCRQPQHCLRRRGRLLPSAFSFLGLWPKQVYNSFLVFAWPFVAIASYCYLLSLWVGIYFNGSVKLVATKQHFGADISEDGRTSKTSRLVAVSWGNSSVVCGAKALISSAAQSTWNVMEIIKNKEYLSSWLTQLIPELQLLCPIGPPVFKVLRWLSLMDVRSHSC